MSVKFKRLKPLEDLSSAEQLLAALLRSDPVASEKLLTAPNLNDRLNELIELIKDCQFARLVLDRLYDIELMSLVPEQTRACLTQLALKETAIQKVFERRFVELQKLLSEFVNDIVWIKGSSLSRTIYERKYYRHSGDVDIVVRTAKVQAVVARLMAAGFTWSAVSSDCNQVGCGPTSSAKDLLLTPSSELIPSSSFSLYKDHWPQVDLKFGPFDTGLEMHEYSRFFADSEFHECDNQKFLAPCITDHLLICVHTLCKDRFTSWKTLFDVHMLILTISKQPHLWNKFVTCCQSESMTQTAWAGLVLSTARFGSVVPDSVLNSLAPTSSLWQRLTFFTSSTAFVWNSASLPMLVFNATTSDDSAKKLQVLAKAFWPSRTFLSEYYNARRSTSGPYFAVLVLLHWIVLVLPGGLTRRTLGRFMWKNEATAFKTASEAIGK